MERAGCVCETAVLGGRGSGAEVDRGGHATGLEVRGARANVGVAHDVAVVTVGVPEGPEGVLTGALGRAEQELVGFDRLATAEAALWGGVHGGGECE